MFGSDNTIEQGSSAQARAREPSRVFSPPSDPPIREATRAEMRRLPQQAPDVPLDGVAQQHKLYVSKGLGQTRKYFSDYQQKSEVMRANPSKITTKLDDRQTVTVMLDLAQQRGWSSVNIKGTDAFRREAWVQASERGMQVHGYTPTATDGQELTRRQAASAPVQAAPSAVRTVPVNAGAAPAAPQTGQTAAVAPSAPKAGPDGHKPSQAPAAPVSAPGATSTPGWGSVEAAGKGARQIAATAQAAMPKASAKSKAPGAGPKPNASQAAA